MIIAAKLGPKYRVLICASASLFLLLVFVISRPESLFTSSFTRNAFVANDAPKLTFPKGVTKLHINIGANLNPILPPKEDDSVAVLAVEANIGIASHLREKYQKVDFPHRFFVLPCAMAGADRAGSVSTFHFYNVVGVSSSLSRAGKGAEAADWTNHTKFDPTSKYGPGPAAMDYVPVLSLEALLRAVPTDIHIPYLKIDTQGFDFNVIKGASLSQLRRIRRIMSETYLLRIGARRYEINENDLKDWIPYMRKAGYVLTNPPPEGKGGEYDAIWELQD